MIELFNEEVESKSKELVSHLRKRPNEYNYNFVIQFAKWYNEKVTDYVAIRERCLKMANDLSPEGTDESAITKKAEEYYKFILNI